MNTIISFAKSAQYQLPVICQAPGDLKIAALLDLVEDRITRPGVEGFISRHSLRVGSAASLA